MDPPLNDGEESHTNDEEVEGLVNDGVESEFEQTYGVDTSVQPDLNRFQNIVRGLSGGETEPLR